MENTNGNDLAEKIAIVLQNEQSKSDDFLRLSVEKINRRLDYLESGIARQNFRKIMQTPNSFHPSQEKFLDLEELAVEVINNLEKEKACPFEPAGKPCDHCSMCNSRGF